MTTFVMPTGPLSRRPHAVHDRRQRRGRSRHFGAGHGFGRAPAAATSAPRSSSLLAEQPMHGYQIIQELAERTGGVWRPSPGSVYPTLQQLEDEELVRETAAESGKRVYELTDAGREQASARRPPWTRSPRRATTRSSRSATSPTTSSQRRDRSRTPGRRHRSKRRRRSCATRARSLYRLLADED